MEVADIRETSCSEETPPKITQRLSLLLLLIAITPHIYIVFKRAVIRALSFALAHLIHYYTMPRWIDFYRSPCYTVKQTSFIITIFGVDHFGFKSL